MTKLKGNRKEETGKRKSEKVRKQGLRRCMLEV
jgi:hypothetical protein